MPPVIKPTVGRVLWYWKLGAPNESNPDLQPEAATVTYVWNDHMVNLVVFDRNGNSRGVTSVALHQPGDENFNGGSPHACWMPYQTSQASKTEELERALAASQR